MRGPIGPAPLRAVRVVTRGTTEKTPLLDFQNERLVPYLLVFLLGSLCARQGLLHSERRSMKLYIAVSATAWIPVTLYLVMLLNFFLRPETPIISGRIDGLLLWFGLSLSMLALLYCTVTTFKYFVHRQRRLGASLSTLAYNVYIVHVVILGLIAWALLDTDLPVLLKYPILALATYSGSNIVVFFTSAAARHLRAGRRRLAPPRAASR